MGYGLLVFDSDQLHAITGMEVLDWVDSVAAELSDIPVSSLPAALQAFDAALTAEFPPGELTADLAPGEDGETLRPTPLVERSGEGPRYYRGPRGIYIDCPFSLVDTMDPRVRALALEYELGYYDAEENRLLLPPSLTERLSAERIEAGAAADIALKERIEESAARRAAEAAEYERQHSGWRGLLRRVFGSD